MASKRQQSFSSDSNTNGAFAQPLELDSSPSDTHVMIERRGSSDPNLGGGTEPQEDNTNRQTAAHMFISFVGAGVLGLPYAFSKLGLFGSVLVLPMCGAVATYAMIILVRCKIHLQEQGKVIRGYGDIALYSLGPAGAKLINILIVVTQVSFCVAYLIFIGENVTTVFPAWGANSLVVACIPGLSMLVMFRQLSKLAPFTLFADVANFGAFLIVMCNDVELFREHETIVEDHTLEYVNYGINLAKVPYFFGIVMYCYEGVGVILTIHESMENKRSFNKVLIMTMCAVTGVYLVFGTLGYMAYGRDTKEIITLNLGDGMATHMVKLALSTGLFFTYPLMMFPVFSIVENVPVLRHRPRWNQNVMRVAIVFLSVFIALGVPNFGDFISLVGAGACAALAMIFPAYLYLKMAPGISETTILVNNVVFFAGIVFGLFGTMRAAESMFLGKESGPS